MRRILILGGARFHGFLLAEYLSEKGNEVFVLNRGNYRKDYPFKIKRIIADRNNSEDLRKALEGLEFDCIVDNNAYDSNQIEILLNIIRGRVKHYLFTSTNAVYMTLSSENPLKETDSTGTPSGFYSPDIINYSKNKYEAENKLKGFDINYTVLRPPNIFGEGDFAGKLTFFNERFKDGKKILLDKEIKNFSIIYAGDIPKIYDSVIGNKECFKKTINIADSGIYDYESFFSQIFDNYSKKNIVLMDAEKIYQLGYRLSFCFGAALDISLCKKILKPSFTHIAEWGKRTLEWERKNLDGKKISEYKLLRERELAIIKDLQ